ncbi:MAG: 23S rRNA (adenine(2503)-C(2))-methyltransferase RlmN [Proteobacteria bacterium]|nr:23S rRNA (adenine(2503)-C(2))-methyltransferase RlmN [Pseudomonadota bacterium]
MTNNSSQSTSDKISINSLTQKELENAISTIGEKPFRAKQIWNWLYVNGVKDFGEMKNISQATIQKLQENYSIKRPKISKDLQSKDGTRKWLLKFGDQEIEAVFIPEEKRGTLCISSQIGCTLTCKFCHTGTQLLVRNLDVSEIIAQVMLAKDALQDWKLENGQKHKITNIVFMGMGEPFFNYDNVIQAIKILNDCDGMNFSRRRITVSTSGLIPEIRKFADEIKTDLAISLHATNDELRNQIMPINKKYPLDELMAACKYYNDLNPSQKITFEYVMLKGVNDSDEDALALANLIKDNQLTAIVNLIPFNSWCGAIYECSSRNRIMKFSSILTQQGIRAPIRKTRGEDVMAACGQLKSASQRPNKNKPQ